MTTSKVPSLEAMREMSDAELLRLRTDLAYDRGVIGGQIQAFEEYDLDPDWAKRAKGAQYVREYGIGAIKNILAERSAERSHEPMVPLQRWMEALYGVIEAARALIDTDEDPDDQLWDALESALTYYDDFSVRYSLANGVIS